MKSILDNWKTSLIGLVVVLMTAYGYFITHDLKGIVGILTGAVGVGLLLADDGKSTAAKLSNYKKIYDNLKENANGND
jgi:hypothetical protein